MTDDLIGRMGKRPGSLGRSDYHYAVLVHECQLAMLIDAKRPNAVVARKHSLDPITVRNLLQESRRRGLSEAIGRGRIGWKLTEKGRQVLLSKGFND
jgi:hypothetical protein